MNQEEIKSAIFCRSCDLDLLSVEDTIFALTIAENLYKDLTKNKSLTNLIQDMLDYKLQIFEKLIEKLRNLSNIFVVFSKTTNMQYFQNVGKKSQIWIFTNENLCDNCIDYFEKYNMNLFKKKYNQEEFLKFLEECIDYEVNTLLINNGVSYVNINLIDWLISIPIERKNKIYFSSNFLKYFYEYMQQVNCNKINEDILQQKQLEMLYSLKSCEFLIPIKNEKKMTGNILKDTLLSFIFVSNELDEKMWPVFTDWKEFRKWDKEKKFDGYIVNYESLKNIYIKIIESSKGNEIPIMTLKPKGFHFPLNIELFEVIETIEMHPNKKGVTE